jgi:electron transfer flavoprotein alpha subunit
MSGVLVLIEHRQGEIREISYEMLGKAKDIAAGLGAEVQALLCAGKADPFMEKIRPYAQKVLVVEDEQLESYNAPAYHAVLMEVLKEQKPQVVLIGHTACGMELAPRLEAALRWPLASDCVDVTIVDGAIEATRKIYSEKVNVRVGFRGAANCLITMRAGSAPAEIEGGSDGDVVSVVSPLGGETWGRRFLEYVEAAIGEVDITQAEILVSVGRGIGDAENIPLAEEFADALGATLSCSRPVVDKKWLPKERQVGTSGKTVKPKVYIALGISGAFQHVAGMKNAGTIIAVNKDPKAPIFAVADYGIVDDLFNVLPALTEKVKAL